MIERTHASDLSARSPRFLVIRAGAIGDTLMATPLLRSLRTSFPDAYIGALTSARALDVLRYNPHLDEVFPIFRRHLPFLFSAEKRRLAKHFQSLNLDAVLSLEAHSSFTALACRFRAQHLITYDPKTECGKTTRILPADDEHSIEVHNRAGAVAGAKSAGMEMELYYPPEFDSEIEARLLADSISRNDRLIGIHAGWGGRRQSPDDTRLRSWPANRFAELIQRISRRFDAKILLTGTRLDRTLNDKIAGRSDVPVVNAAGSFSLLESAALIRRMGAYVTIDSGPAHIAAAVGTPLITLWGPGIFAATRPIAGKGVVKILRSPPPCAPCYGTSLMKSCTDNICMKRIHVNDVENALAEVIE